MYKRRDERDTAWSPVILSFLHLYLRLIKIYVKNKSTTLTVQEGILTVLIVYLQTSFTMLNVFGMSQS